MSTGFHHRVVWRRSARWGVRRGPDVFVRYAPLLIGWCFALLLPQARRAVLRNLRRIRGRRDGLCEAADVLTTFAQFACCFAESLGPDRARKAKGWTRIRGAGRVRRILQQGRGLVLVTAHAGPWDSAARILAAERDVRVLLVMGEETTQAAAGIQDAVRRSGQVEVVRLGKHPLDALPVVQHLQEGGIVALQLDRAPPARPATVCSLFEEPFAVPTGPFVLAGLAGAPVLPVFTSRHGYYQRVIDVGEPVYPRKRASEFELRATISQVLAQMEQHLRRFPTQWFHFLTDREERQFLEAASRPSTRSTRRRPSGLAQPASIWQKPSQ